MAASDPFDRAEWLDLVALASRDARARGQRLDAEGLAWLKEDYLRSYEAGHERHLSQPCPKPQCRGLHPHRRLRHWTPAWLWIS